MKDVKKMATIFRLTKKKGMTLERVRQELEAEERLKPEETEKL
jgi:hypothetical protein